MKRVHERFLKQADVSWITLSDEANKIDIIEIQSSRRVH
jgi:hypothetical protein